MQLSVTGFVQLARILKGLATELCMGHLVFTLEGGYHLEALASAVRATLEVLLGREEIVDPLGRSPLGRKASDIKDVIRQVKRVHSLD
jgi:acetoin utilization deacetylase AcuC-like enzyme